jgi:NitT/TauT family transport system ATP-binding protein
MNTTQAKNLLYLENIYKRYGEKIILDDIDLSVTSGELVTLVGPSGCGKSTLLRLILGQEFPTSGTLLIDGKFPGFPNPERGIVYQKYSLFPHLTVLENVMAGPSLSLNYFERRRTKKEKTEEAIHYLDKVKLKEHLSKYPHELSGGMRQRTGLARALTVQSDILMMDEPFSAVDEQMRRKLQEDLLELLKVEKKTVIFVTHSIEEAVYLADQVVILSGRPGKIANIVRPDIDRDGEVDVIRRQPRYVELVDEIWGSLRRYVE